MSGSAENEKLFKPVGDAAEEVNMEESQNQAGVKNTGAADSMGHPVQEIESLCMNCHKNGITRLLLTSIPYFKEIVIMSFECPHCGFKNAEIQPASQIQEKGAKYMLKIEERSDFNRQVIKSETATCKFLELDIEIPPKRGQLTTVEGLLSEMIDDLEADQEARKTIDESLYEKIETFICKVKKYINCEPGTLPLTFILDDPAGNSWIEYKPGEPLHKWSHTDYFRTEEQNVQVGIITRDQLEQRQREKLAELSKRERNPSEAVKVDSTASEFLSDATEIENYGNEVQTFKASCPSCMHECETHMKPVNIPHFKEVIIMSTVCDNCGYRSNEVKTGGAIPDRGKKITLYCDDPADLSRDILKSETCTLVIPELHVEVQQGTLGGRFTTLEGLMKQVYDELETRVYSQTSDSMDDATKHRWQEFFGSLKEALEGKKKFTVIMEDPLAGSYIQNVYAPDEDPNMTIEEFERTKEQNEDLGLNDIKVDH
ncbi:probable Zinc finger protein ZPR1 [Zygosaccharomyces bailii]|uniref:ZYBA0S07-00980g1_1 n=1 Tax=Zygosaccharomyces bailii (strain CLIB 213 / ATCC 58445 / CBS 680 / BCRC 21525 / NBRC 1098 / NCYC 1416 / NRRL Y-2227) TaxID=1333698 RepID=A0A8J2X255_ZYGB2|nr:ZYBA0S07-00980g1_1 [Zygosaccharomyces bailii CLIB 213]SJM83954.1 probable Zinc finger protein ZPR1 [Zygosaccharomyces bailii]